MILVFDLDDTLYQEIDYVRSGFRAVAKYLAEEYALDEKSALSYMNNDLDKNGRGKIFDSLLIKYDLLTKTNIKKCVSVYRQHIPDIQLDEPALNCLNRFKDLPKYLVTDGNKIAQRNKVNSLNLKPHFKQILLTSHFGLRHAKPSPYCILKISKIENVSNEKVVYIGDNPKKDFVGIKPFGFKTIRIRQGMYKNLTLPKENEAHICLKSLDDLNNVVLNTLLKRQ